MSHETYLVVPDLHVPYHDPAYMECVRQALKILRPKGIVQLGDAVDCWQISTYSKDPRRRNRLADDIHQYREVLADWSDLLPKGAVIHQLEGNHEDRLRRYLHSLAPAIVELHPSWPELLKLSDLPRVKWHPLAKWNSCRIADTVFHHGTYFDKHTAVSNLVRYPCNLVQGHSHRLQYAEDGYRWSATLGHGSLPEETMHEAKPSTWQQAFGVYDVIDGRGHLTVVRVKDGVCVVRNKLVRVS